MRLSLCLFAASDRRTDVESMTPLQSLAASSTSSLSSSSLSAGPGSQIAELWDLTISSPLSADASFSAAPDNGTFRETFQETFQPQRQMSLSSVETVVTAASNAGPKLPSVSSLSSSSSSASAAKPSVIAPSRSEVTQLRSRKSSSSSAALDFYTEVPSDVETIYSVQVSHFLCFY